MLRSSAVLLAVVACLSGAVVAGCGSKSSSSSSAATTSASQSSFSTATGRLPTAKFALHFGLAGGAFHRWIYKPFKAGAFGKPLSHKAAIAKAALASLFIFHELKLAAADARQSSVLKPLIAPLDAAAAKVSALRQQLAGGHYNPADINAIQADGGQIHATAASKGVNAPDINVSNPTGAGAPTG
jgi:hypothetical protein